MANQERYTSKLGAKCAGSLPKQTGRGPLLLPEFCRR
eukprot:CAMPEP_0172844248 /NCGR_PEP_ID=MMETSP1075-20121228/32060_1 /TAXON_ID=2916 /ORGANISM="Ceratium fusus, Strain PA161109" /LENGTH=36 /DNA_ID= /DNA_START= /DNA_END= /DNA_ORIENTATION=